MTPDRWNKLRSLYDVALDTPPEQRARVLASNPDADPDLVDEVLRMIARGEAAGDLLHNSRARNLRQELLSDLPLLQPGDIIARRFRVDRLLGRNVSTTLRQSAKEFTEYCRKASVVC